MKKHSFIKACFSSWESSLLSIGFLVVFGVLVFRLLNWTFFQATFIGTDNSECLKNSGACWVFVSENISFFIYGMLDLEQRWRANLFMAAIFVSLALLFWQRTRAFGLWFNMVGMPIFALFLAYFSFGSGIGIDTDTYGGIFLTLFIAYFGIFWALPVGICLALGRRSKLFVIRIFSVLWIELWRGVPLITVLFMSSVLVPYFLPPNVEISKLSRAMIGVIAFSGAYMAEVIRGGLQGVGFGQQEASNALGLSWVQSMRFVILPQALRIVSPAILNNFVSLFKDTTLVSIIGMFDFLGAIQAASKNSAWIGYSTEGYVFSAAIFWAFCFGISKFASRLDSTSKTRYERVSFGN